MALCPRPLRQLLVKLFVHVNRAVLCFALHTGLVAHFGFALRRIDTLDDCKNFQPKLLFVHEQILKPIEMRVGLYDFHQAPPYFFRFSSTNRSCCHDSSRGVFQTLVVSDFPALAGS